MTYETFKYELRKLDFSYCISDTTISVLNNHFETVCFVTTNKRYGIHINYKFYKLDESLQKKLFSLVVGLARTSLDNRGEICKETRWYLKHKYLNTYTGDNYLCQALDTLSLSHKMDGTVLDFQFTKYEIEELGKIINLNDFEMEKVE